MHPSMKQLIKTRDIRNRPGANPTVDNIITFIF